MTKLTIASTDDSPAMWYSFETESEITGEQLEDHDTIEPTDSGRWRVEGITGPTGWDTYIFDDDGVLYFDVYLYDLRNGEVTDDTVDESRFDLRLDGESVSVSDVVVDPSGGDDGTDGTDGTTDDGGRYGGHEPVDLSGIEDRLDSIDERLARIEAKLDAGLTVEWAADTTDE